MKTIRTLLENDNTNTIDWEYYSSTFKISKDDIDKLYKSVVITCMDPKMWKVSPRVYEDILFNGREDLRYSSPSDSDEDIEYHELATQARVLVDGRMDSSLSLSIPRFCYFCFAFRNRNRAIDRRYLPGVDLEDS